MKNVGDKRGQMNISFGLIFAIIAGAFILALAIYGAVKFSKTQTIAIEGETTRTLGILTNPLESSFESSRTITITSHSDTRIYTGCELKEPEGENPNPTPPDEYFGWQLINTTQKIQGKWTEATRNSEFKNKYIFSENPSQGKKFYVFSKPFEIPYKVADLIYVLSSDKKYCFLDADRIRDGDLEKEIKNMKQPSLLIDSEDDCADEYGGINVCFYNLNDCDVRIHYGEGYMTKTQGSLEFEGDALMFAALISDEETYECQISRLIQRAESLAEIYTQKYELMNQEIHCGSDLTVELMIFNEALKKYPKESSLSDIAWAAENLGLANERSECPLW